MCGFDLTLACSCDDADILLLRLQVSYRQAGKHADGALRRGARPLLPCVALHLANTFLHDKQGTCLARRQARRTSLPYHQSSRPPFSLAIRRSTASAAVPIALWRMRCHHVRMRDGLGHSLSLTAPSRRMTCLDPGRTRKFPRSKTTRFTRRRD